MDQPARLTIVIPALDEAERLPASLERIVDYLSHSPHLMPAEVIVVDDGSSDDTAAVARGARSADGITIKVHSHPHNRGKGAAIRSGFSLSRGADLLICDADLATPIEELKALFEAREGRAVVIGSRAVNRDLIMVRQPWYRDLMGRIFNLIQQVLALPGIVDTQCGFKLFPGDLGRALARVQRLNGFAFDVELLVLSRSWGFTVQEIGVRWQHVEASRVLPIRHSSQMLRDLLRIWSWRVAGRLPLLPDSLRSHDQTV